MKRAYISRKKRLKRTRLRKKAKHKTPRQKLRDKAWKLVSEYTRRSEDRCYTCGAKGDWKKAHAGHYKHGHNMDFVDKNIHRQCPRCNKWLHGNLSVYALQLVSGYGHGILYELEERSKLVKKYTIGDLEQLIELYTERLKDLSA